MPELKVKSPALEGGFDKRTQGPLRSSTKEAQSSKGEQIMPGGNFRQHPYFY